MSEQDGENKGPPPQSSAKDIVDLLRGQPTDKQREVFLKATEDLFSDINAMLSSFSKRFRRRNPLAGRAGEGDRSWERLHDLIDYVRQKREEGVFTYEETQTFVEPGDAASAFGSNLLPIAVERAKNNALATRILRAIEKSAP